ncbi:unnamed protein product [Blepharisma stoltei]|uniref:Uncharacterized protein n=1 Tax=Blepharisma stoltei TaxID=1481888 RepID=A0AAU9J4E0_9CILI|nr:unnamed protein product [Blepharisma stoltei]
MDEALNSFRSLLSEFSQDDNTAKENLINSYTALAYSVKKPEDITEEFILALHQFADLDIAFPQFFGFCGYDILEPTILLQIIAFDNKTEPLGTISNLIGIKSRPKELQIQLNAIASYLRSNSEEHPLEQFSASLQNEREDVLNTFKTVILFYVPYILQNLSNKDLSRSLEEFKYLWNFFDKDINIYNNFLSSESMLQFLNVIKARKIDLKKEAYNQSLNLLLTFAAFYEKAGISQENKEIVIDLIEEICGSYMMIINNWINKETVTQNFSDGLSVLTEEVSCKRAMKFPLILSPLRRLQIFLPIVSASAKSLPNTFLNVTSHCLYHFNEKFGNVASPTLLVPKKVSSEDICVAFLDVAGGMFEAKLRNDILKLFEQFLEKFQRHHYINILKNTIIIYPHDRAKGMLIDYLTKDLTKGFAVGYEKYIEIIKETLALRPLLDYLDSYLAAISLYKILVGKLKDMGMRQDLGVKPLLEEIYKELSTLYDVDRSQHKVGLVLWSIKDAEELDKPLFKRVPKNNK